MGDLSCAERMVTHTLLEQVRECDFPSRTWCRLKPVSGIIKNENDPPAFFRQPVPAEISSGGPGVARVRSRSGGLSRHGLG